MKKSACFWLPFWAVFNLFQTPLKAQSFTDSLQKILQTALPDTSRLKIYAQLLKANLYANPLLAQQYAAQYDSLATLMNNETDIAFGKNYLGLARYVNNDYTKAIVYYLEAIKRFEKLKIPLRVGIALNNIGACYQYRDEPKQTVEYYQKALAIFQQLNETTWIGNVSHNIANEYLQMAYRNQEKNTKFKYLNEAEKYEKIALRSFEAQKDNYSAALSYINFGNIKYEEKQFEEAIRDYTKARPLISDKEDPISVGITYENIGNSLFELKRYDEATVNLNKAGEIFRKVNALPNLKKTLDVLLRVYSMKKEYKLAFETQKEFITLSDTIFNQEKDKAMLDVLKKYESDKKEQENKLLNQQLIQEQQQRLAYGIGLVGLLLFSGVIGYFLIRNRQKNRLLNEKNALIERQNARLSDLNLEKNQLISMVSHDLSTPFLVINTWNSILKMSVEETNAKAKEAIQVIEKSARQGMTLIQSILNVEKAETNKHTLQLETFDLKELTREALNGFEEAAKEKQIQFLYEPTAPPLPILSDPHLVRRVLENLLSNALKYSHAGGRVWISTKESPNKVEWKIKDEGIGIEAKHLPRLFDKYNTASTATNHKSSTGLGLSIVKRILDEIGGDIQCRSELGKGTEFTVQLVV
ncbi:MAG: tetratricopeptide repeat-containing sensor histidine kinase [Spirosomataceae bacterium]